MALRGVVFGWYHQRNAGDDRFVHCLERWLHDHELIFLPHTQPPPFDVLSRADYAILGCGSIANQVHGVFSGMKRWIAKAKIPVFGVGLTVSQYPALRDELRSIIDTGGSIWLRDQQSADWLAYDRNVFVGPDITWLYPRSLSCHPAPGTVAINFRPWTKRVWDPVAWGRELARVCPRLVPWPLCFGRDDDRVTLGQVTGSEVSTEEFDLGTIAQAELVVAMRFHALIFAIQAGVPVVAVGNTVKVSNLLDQLGMAECAVPIEQPEQIGEAVLRIKSGWPVDRVREVSSRMCVKAWQVASQFKQHIEDVAQAQSKKRSTWPSRIWSRLLRMYQF